MRDGMTWNNCYFHLKYGATNATGEKSYTYPRAGIVNKNNCGSDSPRMDRMKSTHTRSHARRLRPASYAGITSGTTGRTFSRNYWSTFLKSCTGTTLNAGRGQHSSQPCSLESAATLSNIEPPKKGITGA